jgi:hypothetical protein
MKHTKEPWSLDADKTTIVNWQLSTICDTALSSMLHEEDICNASRIVKCVNVMAEVHDNYIDAVIEGGGVVNLFKERDAYRDLCADLIVALKDAQNTLAHCKAEIGYKHRQTDTAIKINSAITKAEKLLGESK